MDKSATSLDFPPLLFPERVADASIRGFLAQIYRTALRWLDLPDGEFLLCEGDEDLDHYFFNGDGTLREMTQEQFKELNSKLSARSPEVYESIFNFLYLFAEHEREGRKCRFVFTTNASRAAQSVSKKEAVVLDIDLLKTWSELSLGSDKDQQQRRLQIKDNVRKLVNGYGNKPSPKPSRSSMTPERIKTAIEFLNEDPTRWDAFINAVKWSLEDKPYDLLGKSLIERLSKDPRTAALPNLFGHRIIIEVLHASVKSEPQSRILSAQRLAEILGKTKDELLHWAESHHAERLKDWFATVDARLDDHDRRLEDHGLKLDDQFQQLEGHERQIDEQHRRIDEQGARLLAREPLARLRSLTRRTLGRIERSSALKSKGQTLTINRGILGAMVQMPGSFLVVGDAGCGKSVALAGLARHLQETNEVFVLSADELPEVAALIHDIFDGWTDGASPILIIDALDAARGEESANKVWRFLDEFIAENSSWRVIASSRTYDLMARQSRAKSLFSGEPSKLSADSRLPSVAHVRIGPLDDSEIEQLASFSELHTLFHRATPALQKLLRVPFNLSLATELLNEGIEASAIERVQTHLGLLDLYWRYRVEELEPITEEPARRKTLRAACDRMIVDRRFWVDDMQLPESTVLHSLLSGNVLTRADTEQPAKELRLVGFAHLIFFDYACAKVWLPDDPEELVRVLHQHPDLVLVAGPSLGMYMHRLWARDPTRTVFWNVVLYICKDLQRSPKRTHFCSPKRTHLLNQDRRSQ